MEADFPSCFGAAVEWHWFAIDHAILLSPALVRFMASNLGEPYCRAIYGWFLLLLLEVRDDYIVVGLMRAFDVIVFRELFTDMVEMIATEDYEVI
ncbi:MAG: hypothetical protein NTY15_10090 [Planctomycetota bacterium]|nr:hypothetical protein [Planctomycetota bacterium]